MQSSNREHLISKLKAAIKAKELRERDLKKLRDDFCEEIHNKLQTIGSSFHDTPLTPSISDFQLNVDGESLNTHVLTLSSDVLSISIRPQSLVDNETVTGILQVTLESPDHQSSQIEFCLHWRTKTYPKSDWVIVQAGKTPTIFTDEVFCERILTFFS